MCSKSTRHYPCPTTSLPELFRNCLRRLTLIARDGGALLLLRFGYSACLPQTVPVFNARRPRILSKIPYQHQVRLGKLILNIQQRFAVCGQAQPPTELLLQRPKNVPLVVGKIEECKLGVRELSEFQEVNPSGLSAQFGQSSGSMSLSTLLSSPPPWNGMRHIPLCSYFE
jgi:hypothetical protein